MARLFLTVTDRLSIAPAASNGQLANANEQRRPVSGLSIPFKAKLPFLLRLVIGLMSCLVMFSIVAIACGHLNAVPNPITRIGLDRCAAVSCFRGITPGLTDWSKAKATFGLVEKRQIFDHQIFVPIGSDGGAALYPSVDGQTVGLISVAVSSEIPLTIGDIVNQYGPPCVLTLPIKSDDQTLILYYPFLTVFARMSDGRLTVDTPARYIALNALTNLSTVSADLCREVVLEYIFPPNITRPWRGFASVSHYLAAK